MSSRPSWDKYFMDQCDLISKRSTCDRKHVGTVIVRNKRIVCTGYNGSLPSFPHCDDPQNFLQCPKCGWKSPALTSNIAIFHDRCKNCYELLDEEKHLKHGGHDLENDHCQKIIHSEVNAIAQAAKLGISTEGATLYCNTRPCFNCLKTVIAAGINRVVYRDSYGETLNDRVSQTVSQLDNKFSFVKLSEDSLKTQGKD